MLEWSNYEHVELIVIIVLVIDRLFTPRLLLRITSITALANLSVSSICPKVTSTLHSIPLLDFTHSCIRLKEFYAREELIPMQFGYPKSERGQRTSGLSRHRSHDYSSSLSKSDGPSYTKQELRAIDEVLRQECKIVVPSNANIPEALRIEQRHTTNQRETQQQSNTTEWIWISHAGPPFALLRKTEIAVKLDNGEIAANDLLLSLDIAREHGIQASEFPSTVLKKKSISAEIQRSNTVETVDSLSTDPIWTLTSMEWERRKRALQNSMLIMYKDSKGNIQGPFAKDRIMQWWKYGFFPEDLRLRSPETDDFVQLHVLIAAWVCEEEQWHVFKENATQPILANSDTIIQWFLSEDISIHDRLQPVTTPDDAMRWIPASYMLVHWLPFSDLWLVQEQTSVNTMTIADVFDLWTKEYKTQDGILKARPESWTTDVYIPVEMLMKSYGFIV